MIVVDILPLERWRSLKKLIHEWLWLEEGWNFRQSFVIVGFACKVILAFFRHEQSLSPQLLSYKNVHLIVLSQHACRSPPLLGLQSSLSVRYPNRFLSWKKKPQVIFTKHGLGMGCADCNLVSPGGREVVVKWELRYRRQYRLFCLRGVFWAFFLVSGKLTVRKGQLKYILSSISDMKKSLAG